MLPDNSAPLGEEPRRELDQHDLVLVARICRRYRRTPLSFNELVSAGNEGLVHAHRRYDPTFGVPFHSYARHWIQRYVGFAIHQARFPVAVPRDHRSIIRVVCRTRDALTSRLERAPTLSELVACTGLARHLVNEVLQLEQPCVEIDAARQCRTGAAADDELLSDRFAWPVDDTDEEVDAERLVQDLLTNMTDRERTIFRLRCGLTATGVCLSDAAIAEVLGCSAERVRQIRHAAAERLRAHRARQGAA